MPTGTLNISLKSIADEYFKQAGYKPKKTYNNNTLHNIVVQGSIYAITGKYSLLNDYINKICVEYGVNGNLILQWLQKNPTYYNYIVKYANENTKIISPIDNLPENIGGFVSNIFTGFLKGLLPIIIIIVVFYFLLTYFNKQSK